MQKLLIIGGAPATGKTDVAGGLAKELRGELISADSRQVYRGMDVGTGKDRPQGVKIWGYDVVDPDEDFSVADFVELAGKKMKQLWQGDKLPIVVGGTGLYLKSLVELPESLGVKPDKQLRQELDQLLVPELQQKLKQLAPQRFRQMNWSDQHNPRRLVRAIEVARRQRRSLSGQALRVGKADIAWVGLTADRRVLEERIRQRVERRAKGGMSQEVKRLVRGYPDWELPAFSATGYREWRDYLEGKTSREEAIFRWQTAEIQYMRRQLTWFKKMRQFTWFDIDSKSWQNQIRQFVCTKLKFLTER